MNKIKDESSSGLLLSNNQSNISSDINIILDEDNVFRVRVNPIDLT